MDIAIAGIPKTIDNDIPIIDSSFGFQTSVEESHRAIESARVESHSHEYGVGVIKLMGRDSGWIAMTAAMSATSVALCLIPEFPYNLNGENGVLEYCFKRLTVRKRMVIVVAEGAAFKDFKLEGEGTDASGNQKQAEVAPAFTKELEKYCKSKGMKITLKYIDPSYMIRSVPANAYDSKYCAYTGANAVHGLMGGFTGFTNGLVCGKNCLIPLKEICSEKYNKRIPHNFKLWRRFLAHSG